MLETPDETSMAMHDATDKYYSGGGVRGREGAEGKRGKAYGVHLECMRESPRARGRPDARTNVFVRATVNGTSRLVQIALS